MGWMQKLVSTYDNVAKQNAFTDSDNPLAEVGFIDKKAEVMVTLNRDGTFRSAERLRKNENFIINIPTIAEAESRTSTKIAPYPLFDQIKYMSVFNDSDGAVKRFNSYKTALQEWCDKPDAPDTLKVFCKYIARGSLKRDLMNLGISFDKKDEDKQLCCFRILMEDGQNEFIWQREDIRESWRKRRAELIRSEDARLCYVEGLELPILENYPKLKGSGKIISAKDDKQKFQYKGRFLSANEAMQISNEASAKIHNALIWLLDRQGYRRYGLMTVAWTDSGGNMHLPIEDDGDDEDESLEPQTFEEFGRKISSALKGRMQEFNGYRKELVEQVSILALISATQGRISVTYYQELDISDYISRLTDWYTGCSWKFLRYYGANGNRKQWCGVSSPTPVEIAKAVYGKRQVDIARSDAQHKKSATKVMRQLKLRLLHCMVDSAVLPKDLLTAAFHRVSAPQSFCDDKGKWQGYEWHLALSTYCAMLHKHQAENKERVIDVELDTSCTERSYLYGRLLAVVDAAEREALGRDNYRETNAFRYMQLFRQRPFTTWVKLHSLVLPYFSKLGFRSEKYKRFIGEITELFESGDFEAAQPLDGRFLQGYYCQRQAMYAKKDSKQTDGDAPQSDNN